MRRALALCLLFLLLALPLASADHVARGEVQWACGFGSERPGDCGIEAIHEPRFTTAAWIPQDDKVIGVVRGGEAKAYPTRMLDDHEIVHDTIGGEPVVVTWCPLCGSAVVFEAFGRMDETWRSMEFEVSGYLYKHDLVMWEPQTRTLWTQITGTPIANWSAGAMDMQHAQGALHVVPSELTTWQAWKRAHPATLLLSNEGRSYGGAYAGYADSCRFGVSRTRDCSIENLHPKESVIGVNAEGGAVAYPLFAVRQAGGVVVQERTDGAHVVVAEPSGAARVFDAGAHRFRQEGDQWVNGSGDVWDLVRGASADGFSRLERLESVTLYWFAWRAHHPDTELWLPEDATGAKPLRDGRGVPGPGFVWTTLWAGALLWAGGRRHGQQRRGPRF